MEIGIHVEPEGAAFDDLLAVARVAEECGFASFLRSDHFLNHIFEARSPRPTDAWLTIAALARETSTIRLGIYMSNATFRLPGPLAVSAAQVDAMSGGRLELGLGSGWFDRESRAYGGTFLASADERLQRLDEQLEVMLGIWAATPQAPFSYTGRYHEIVDNPGVGDLVQRPHPPITIPASQAPHSLELAARRADECNLHFTPASEAGAICQALDDHCRRLGRDPASLRRSVARVMCCGATDAEVRRRAAAIGRSVDELRSDGAVGSPAEVVDHLHEFAQLGITRVLFQVLDLADFDQLRLIASDVLPALR